MIEAVMFWNEPNNKSHWDFDVDPQWDLFAKMIREASHAVKKVNPHLTRVVGGMSPIDTYFVQNLQGKGALDYMDAVAVHGFPLDWNHWKLNEWPDKIREIQAVTDLPVWVSEVGISTFGAEEVQVFGLRRTAELLTGLAPRIHWYSLYDLPKAWPATTRHREAEGSSYYRHFYMGLLREDGSPKPALDIFHEFTPELGICQWFHFNDHRPDEAVAWLHKLGVKHLRTGLSWADSFRPGAEEWSARQMKALEDFDVTVTFCFTPEHRGIQPHHTSAPLCIDEYVQFCEEMIRRYAPLPGAGAATDGEAASQPVQETIEFPWNGGRSFSYQPAIDAMRFLLRPHLSQTAPSVAVVCAHPGEEISGMGSRLAAFGENLALIYTSGLPAGVNQGQAEQTLTSALRSLEASPAEIRFLSVGTAAPDEQSTELTQAVTAILDELRPDVIITPPYNGQSPARDAASLAVHSAFTQLQLDSKWSPVIIEMALGDSYDGATNLEFPPSDRAVSRVRLSDDQRRAKTAALTLPGTQGFLQIPASVSGEELFRPAPTYDFNTVHLNDDAQTSLTSAK